MKQEDQAAPQDAVPDDGVPGRPERPDTASDEVAVLREKLLRARADYDNLQRRIERERGLEQDRVKARVLEDFLQVYEYGRMAAREAEANPGPLADGIRMVVREFDRLLEAQGVRPLGAEGDAFDPSRHEAVAEEPGPRGQVVRVVAPGYLLGERVLRYARVVVGADDEEE